MIVEAPYQISEVLHRFQQSNVKETHVSINDLKREIKLLKSEISQIKQNNESLSTRMTLLETKSLKLKEIQDVASSSNNEKDLASISNTEIKGYLNLLDQVTSQKWFVKITLLINRDFILDNEVALIDSGADLNCLQEGIIPTKYFSKTTQSLTQAGGDKLIVKYKLSDAYICNQNICLPTSFIMVKGLTHRIILETPFLHNIMPIINIDQTGISTIIDGKEIIFEFITDPQTRMLNEVRNFLLNKEKQLCFLKEEIEIVTQGCTITENIKQYN